MKSKYIQLYKNGAGAGLSGFFLASTYFQNDQANQPMIVVLLSLSAGDYLEVYVNSYAGGNHTISGGLESYFAGYKIIE